MFLTSIHFIAFRFHDLDGGLIYSQIFMSKSHAIQTFPSSPLYFIFKELFLFLAHKLYLWARKRKKGDY